MGVSFIQKYRVMGHVLNQRFQRRRRYPLVLMIEPLFRCNLACAGCGKTNYPEEILDRRLSLEECLASAEECGTPIVSIAGGEPLIHEEMPKIVAGIIRQKRFVYLCTNGLMLKTHLRDYTPSPYLTISVHLDGHRGWHDALVCQPGVYDRAVEAIRLALAKGFRVTVNSTLYEGITAEEVATHFDFVMDLGVEGINLSPGYMYSHAQQEAMFLNRTRSQQLFRDIYKLGKGHRWRFNQSKLFLDFLAGNQTYPCTPWGNPTRNIFGWQKPCYLLVDEGYAPSFKALMEETDWDRYGPGRNPKCSNCMLHSGFEATAVHDMLTHPFKALHAFLRGPATEGPMTPELPITHLNLPRVSRKEEE
ncbi:MAG TPA: adenosyl-hopene transferase HpnH [Thermodesulfobacteriota bacterium]|nr:adenosyl-hopene transferase HpnH [Thermodesulfobacteriota bacterium]